jgi:micrococcal nuclease
MAGRQWLVLIGVVGLLAPLHAVAESSAPLAQCMLEPGPIRTVTRVVDGETLVLDDGKVIRLIGALAPRARDASASPGAWPPEIDTIKALSDLVLAKKIKLAFAGRRADRYGRVLAQVFLEDRGGEEWVQGTLLANGDARAYGLPESFGCSRELLAHEAEARRKRLGLWSNGVYRTMPADHPGELMKQRGKYARVTGTVVSVGRTKGATYLNFSNDWRSDFTARIDKKVLAANPEFDRSLDGLANKTVVLRGWIERRNGPLIDIADPSQLEMQDGASNPADISEQSPKSPTEPVRAPGDPASGAESRKELRPAPTEGAEPGAVNL